MNNELRNKSKVGYWGLTGLILSGLLLGLLLGTSVCSILKTEEESKDGVSEKESVIQEDSIEMTEMETEYGDSEDVLPDSDKEARNYAFGKALWDAYQQGVLPDGHPLDYTCMEAAANNSFSIIDVDGDGQEELLLFWVDACMGGMGCHVFGYDEDSVYEELEVFPTMTFYDNGAVKADWSHNQGLAGDFWPYDVYQYDAENDMYLYVGAVDAWDKSLREDNEQGVLFPDDIDEDGDGILYYLLPADWDWADRKHLLADGSEYEKWRDGYFSDAKEIPLQTKELTEENIAALGCPNPYIELPQPVG